LQPIVGFDGDGDQAPGAGGLSGWTV